MGHVIRVEETEEQVAAGGFVATGNFDASVWVADHRRARFLDVFEIELLKSAGLVEGLGGLRVVIGPEIFLERSCIVRRRPDEFRALVLGREQLGILGNPCFFSRTIHSFPANRNQLWRGLQKWPLLGVLVDSERSPKPIP